MKKKELDQIISKIEAAVKNTRETANILRDSSHPQQRETYLKADARADAFESCLEALRGNQVYLDIWARQD